MTKRDIALVVVAAGQGQRLGAGKPKAFVDLVGRPLLTHAIESIIAMPDLAQLVIAVPETFGARRMIEVARTLNPKIDIIVRVHSDEEADLLRKDQANTIFMGEQELALAMTRHVLQRMSAS